LSSKPFASTDTFPEFITVLLVTLPLPNQSGDHRLVLSEPVLKSSSRASVVGAPRLAGASGRTSFGPAVGRGAAAGVTASTGALRVGGGVVTLFTGGVVGTVLVGGVVVAGGVVSGVTPLGITGAAGARVPTVVVGVVAVAEGVVVVAELVVGGRRIESAAPSPWLVSRVWFGAPATTPVVTATTPTTARNGETRALTGSFLR
jgi:hypothetical protein